jgi:hypothetical protein
MSRHNLNKPGGSMFSPIWAGDCLFESDLSTVITRIRFIKTRNTSIVFFTGPQQRHNTTTWGGLLVTSRRHRCVDPISECTVRTLCYLSFVRFLCRRHVRSWWNHFFVLLRPDKFSCVLVCSRMNYKTTDEANSPAKRLKMMQNVYNDSLLGWRINGIFYRVDMRRWLWWRQHSGLQYI